MKKIIDNKKFEIRYYGSVEELKVQLGNFYESLFNIPKENIAEELNNLEKIIRENYKNISTYYERGYYCKDELYYRVNSSSKEEQKFIFPIMKKRAERIDKRFLRENPHYSLEIEEN